MSQSMDKLKEKAQIILDYHRNKKTDVIAAYITNTRYLAEKRDGRAYNRMEFTVEILTTTNKFSCEEAVFEDCYSVSSITLVQADTPHG